MARLRVRFEWLTGLKQLISRNVRLVGSGDRHGRYSDQTRIIAMKKFTAPDGCPDWRADVRFDAAQRGWTFCWGVIVDTPHQTCAWGIPTEVGDPNPSTQERSIKVRVDGQVERCWLTHCPRLGANKLWRKGARNPALMFSVWAPNAREVDAVIGDPATGYIWSDGQVVDLALAPPPGETTHWTGRMLAKAAGVSLRSVQRILKAHQLAPHRVRSFKLSKDPKFAEKLRDIVGLNVDPPAHAIVLPVDEKSHVWMAPGLQEKY